MKVLRAEELRHAEAQAVAEGASEEQFMQQAGEGVAHWIQRFVSQERVAWEVTFLCGKGNNAGDGYVAALLLQQAGYLVRAFQLFPIDQVSPLCRHHFNQFVERGGVVHFVDHVEELPFPTQGAYVDALLGTGARGALTGKLAELLHRANEANLVRIAIDLPTGVDPDSGEVDPSAFRAHLTVTLGAPKRGFFLGEGRECVGKIRVVHFGLENHYLDPFPPSFRWLDRDAVIGLLPPIRRTRDKYAAGELLLFAGSRRMPGAALLAAEAALRCGAGIARLFHTGEWHPLEMGGMHELVTAPWEEKEYGHLLEAGGALLVGPGLGRSAEVGKRLAALLPLSRGPTILDGDALYFLAQKACLPPKGALLTPHTGEMRRLLGDVPSREIDPPFLQACQEYVDRYEVILILKGVPTFVFEPGITPPFVMDRGDPGMATAGSGDVLAGFLGALVAGGMSLLSAAQLGILLHALAGEEAARTKSSYSLIASDLIAELPKLFVRLDAR